ncbi:MAG: hypothetical protein HOO67_04050 [Candidatus Peribacteraceae bacterium]|nr:hypothetical protein [Candidatus Peribacteraceae bacterium]
MATLLEKDILGDLNASERGLLRGNDLPLPLLKEVAETLLEYRGAAHDHLLVPAVVRVAQEVVSDEFAGEHGEDGVTQLFQSRVHAVAQRIVNAQIEGDVVEEDGAEFDE